MRLGINCVHHRDLDTRAFAGLLSLVECRDDCTIKVDATKKSAMAGPALTGSWSGCPVTLNTPDIACTVRSMAVKSR